MSLVIDLSDLPPPSSTPGGAEDVRLSGGMLEELSVLDGLSEDAPSEAKEEDDDQETATKGVTPKKRLLDQEGPLPDHSFDTIYAMLRSTLNLKEKWITPGKVGIMRLINQIDTLMFNPDSVQRAAKWYPRAGDVVIAASPHSGHALIEKMTRLLLAKNNDEGGFFNQVKADLDLTTAPWIENAAVDRDPDVLERGQLMSDGRVFRTALAHSMLSMKIEKVPEAKFIAVFRDPAHLRAVWYEHAKSVYVEVMVEQTRSDDRERWAERFCELFTFDDLVEMPVTVVQTTRHVAHKHNMEYEFNVRDWMATSLERDNCLVVFIEEVLTSPIAFVKKLAAFLGKEHALERLSRGATSIVEAVAEYLEAEGKSRMPPAKPSSAWHVPDAKDEETHSSSLPFPFHLSSLSVKGVRYLDMRWGDVFGTSLPSYANLYESKLDEAYPLPLPTAFCPPKSRVSSLRLTKHSSMESTRSSTGNKKRSMLRNAMSAEISGGVRASADSDGGSSLGSSSSPKTPSKRKTIIGRIFGNSPLSSRRKSQSLENPSATSD